MNHSHPRFVQPFRSTNLESLNGRLEHRKPEPNALTNPLCVEQVFREHGPRVYSVARRMLGNDADAEDVTQEVLLLVLRKSQTFRGEALVSTWLHRITVNAVLALRRKRASSREQKVTESLEQFSEAGLGYVCAQPEPHEQVMSDELRHLLETSIAKLPELYRNVYVLADVEGLPNLEIGSLLGLGLAAVKSRLHRARLLMRAMLAPHFQEACS